MIPYQQYSSSHVLHDPNYRYINGNSYWIYAKQATSDTIASIKPIFDIKIKFGYLLKKWNFGVFGGINYLQMNYKPFGITDYLLPNSDPIPDWLPQIQSNFKQNQNGFYPMLGLNIGYKITKHFELMGEYSYTHIGIIKSTNISPYNDGYFLARNNSSFSFSQFKLLLNYYWQ